MTTSTIPHPPADASGYRFPDGPRPRPILGSSLDFSHDPLGYLTDLHRAYGDAATVHFMRGYSLVGLFTPAATHDVLAGQPRNFTSREFNFVLHRVLGDGLLTIDGDFHRSQRRMVQPAFHRKRIEHYAVTMTDHTQEQLATWHPGETRDVAVEMQRLTLRIVAKTLFNVDLQKSSNHLGQAFTDVITFPNARRLSWKTLLRINAPFTPYGRYRRGIDTLDSAIYAIIAERRKSREDTGDMLSMLLQAQDDDESLMTDKQVRDETMTFFGAGHETTANALAWTFYLLSQNPAVRDTLQEELRRVLAGRVPTAEDLPQLVYTGMVLKEAMRIFPPVWAIGRRAVEDFTIGDYHLPAGQTVLMSAMGDAPRSGDLGAGRAGIQAGAVRSSTSARDATVRLFPLWRRPAHVHRHAVRSNGSVPAAGDDRPALSFSSGPRASRRAATNDHVTPEIRLADDPGTGGVVTGNEAMAFALDLARSARAVSSPNPPAGAVILRDGAVVGSGATQPVGGPHAEVMALRAAGDLARGATMFVTLEPHSFHGHTPPCTEAIIAAGISTVHIATLDPNPRVQGQGVAQLHAAGIAVTVGLGADEAAWLVAPFAHWLATARPLGLAKFAMSLDGKIATRACASQWITGPAARRVAHEMRNASDAIIVGINTALADDPLPRLACRICRRSACIIPCAWWRIPPDACPLRRACWRRKRRGRCSSPRRRRHRRNGVPRWRHVARKSWNCPRRPLAAWISSRSGMCSARAAA